MATVKLVFLVTTLTLMLMDVISDLEAGWSSVKMYLLQSNYNYTGQDCDLNKFNKLSSISYEIYASSRILKRRLHGWDGMGKTDWDGMCKTFMKSTNDKNLMFGIVTLAFATIIPGLTAALSYLADNQYSHGVIKFVSYVIFFPVLCFGYTVTDYFKPNKYVKEKNRLQNTEVYFEAFPQLLLRMSMIMNDPYASFLGSFDIAFLTSGIHLYRLVIV